MIDRIQKSEGLGGQVEQVREQALELAATAREQLAEGRQTLRNYIVAHPERALGIAVGMGVFLGWLIKRR